MRPTVSIDFDGTLHEHSSWQPGPFGEIDAALIRKLHRAGYAVAVSTCNDVHRVSEALRRLGFTTFPDYDLRHATWDGGPHGKVVLCTGRKVAASCYLDDRAVAHCYGDDHDAALDAAAALAALHRD